MNTRRHSHFSGPTRMAVLLAGLTCCTVQAQEIAVVVDPSPDASQDGSEFRQYGQIEITGSSIVRKEQTQALPVQIITRKDIQRLGKASLPQLIQGLAGVFNGRDLSQWGSPSGGHMDAGLHGMPTGTLVLLNGKRLAPFGYQSSTGKENNGVDLDFLPLAAVERIELLTDGASSLYGTDAIAGVINVITRSESKGFELSADVTQPQGAAGQSRTASLTWGSGSLLDNGYSIRLTAELNKTDRLAVADRPYAGMGRQYFTRNGQAYFADSAYVSSNTSPAWFYSAGTPAKVWSPLYQNGACTGNSLSYTGYTGTCKANLHPTLDIYPSIEGRKLHAQAQFLLPNAATLYAEVQHSQSESQMATTTWAKAGGRVQNVVGAPGYAELLAHGMNPALSNFYWQPDLPALGQGHENAHTRIATGIKGEIQDWNYNLGLYRSRSSSVLSAESADYFQAGIDKIVSGAKVSTLLPEMLQPLDANNPLTAKLLNSRAWNQQVRGQVTLEALEGRVSGPLFEINGKDVLLGIGGDYRWEEVDTRYNADMVSTPSFKAKRHSQAAYSELQIPLTPDWDVIASARADNYSDVGSTAHGKLASRWAINSEWAIRGAVGSGFRAPSAGQTQVFANNYVQSTLAKVITCNSALNTIAAGLQPTANSQAVYCVSNSPVRVYTNGNPDLKPEKSEQKTLGLAFTPHRNLTFAVDYWRVDMRDTLQFESSEAVLADPLKYRANIIADPNVLKLAYNMSGNYNVLGLYLQMRNWGQSVKEGLDLDVKYREPFEWGRLLLGLQATYMLQSKARLSPESAWVSDLGAYSDATVSVTPRWRSRWMVGVEMGEQQWQLNINHESGYTDQSVTARNATQLTASQVVADEKVPGFITADLIGIVQLARNTELKLGVFNLFNSQPPQSFYSASNAVWGVNSQGGSLYGRTWQLGVNHRF